MQNEEFITFERFNNPSMAHELGYVFKENNIEFQYEQNIASFNPILGNEQKAEFRIKIRQHDFKKADILLQTIYNDQVENTDPDYYLFNFTDIELLEIITKRDEWGPFDFVLAQKILKDRGKEINPEVVEIIKENRIKELAKTEDSQHTWITAGYMFALLGGLLGLFIGLHLLKHKKTLPTGDKVYAFSVADRKSGQNIIALAVVSLAAWLFIRVYYELL